TQKTLKHRIDLADMSENHIISLYTEMTPNPESLKFVLNKMLYPAQSIDFQEGDDTSRSALAGALFESFDYIKGVFVMNNFVTIRKEPGQDWFEIKRELGEFIKNWVSEGKEVVVEEAAPELPDVPDSVEGESIDDRIRKMLDQYVKPAVEMDGGAIQFKEFNDGIVTVMLQGSCSGCPSSSVTLKAGIEGLLKRMVPEVKEVVAESV
ncbi:MAG: Fe-S cluster biogenesis protein NfuA, partial [Limisphaerales bacterium]